MSAHVPTRCDDCEQTDDHPKLHYGVDTYHHDCLPPRARREVIADPMIAKIVHAAERDELRGEALRQHIFTLHAPSDETTED